MFTQNHFIWLIACFISIFAGLFAANKRNISVKAATLIMFVICLVSELSKMAVNMIESSFGGYVLYPRALPFHLCSLLIFVVPYIAFTNNEEKRDKAISFIVPVGLIGGVAAILIPTNGVDFLDIEAYQCFVYHSGLIWYSLYLILTGKAYLGKSAYLRNLGMMSLLALGSIYINSALSSYGTNFMYTVRPPMSGLPILNLDNGWIPYFLTLAVLGLILISLVHLPFLVKERRAQK